MSELLGPLLQAGASIGGAAASPPPNSAYRGPDYNPVTNLNLVAPVDLSQVGELVRSIGSGQAAGAQTFFNAPATGGSGIAQILNPQSLLYIAVIGVVGLIAWKKFGR